MFALKLFALRLTLNASSSPYQHAFVYVRQLAIHLRNALAATNKKDAFKAIYNWQFINSLRVWTKVVAAYPEESGLRPLVYVV